MASLKIVMLPPQSELYRAWARRLADISPDLHVAVPENDTDAADAIADADGAVGVLPPNLLAGARSLRWLQSY